MHLKKNSTRNRLLLVLVFSLIAVCALAPVASIADGNGGLPVGGSVSDDTIPAPAPQEPSDPESGTNLFSILWIVALTTF